MLTFAEEVLLLSHDEKEGRFLDMPREIVDTALAGAVLMDLALLGRIDTDLERLFVVDPKLTGEPLLDGVLVRLHEAGAPRSTDYWLEMLQRDGPNLYDDALERLVQRGILKREEHRILWVFPSRRYPLVDDKPQQEVKQRIVALLGNNEIPDVRDVMIVALADACGLLARVLPADQLAASEARIRQIVRLDLIGHSIRAVISSLQTSMINALGYASVR